MAIKEKNSTEIAGPWSEVKDYYLSWPRTRDEKLLIESVINEIIALKKYKANSLLTVEEVFEILDLVTERAKETKTPEYAGIPNTKLAHELRKTFCRGNGGSFEIATKDLEAEIIFDDVYNKVSPRTTITFDICCNHWFNSGPEDADHTITITADEILEARGLLKKPSGSGRRGGYWKEQREEVAADMMTLHKTFIGVEKHAHWFTKKGKWTRGTWSFKSPALQLEFIERRAEEGDRADLRGAEDKYNFVFKPGKVFTMHMVGENLQYAQLNQKVWEYDYDRQAWEIGLAYYFSFLWRTRAYRSKQLLLRLNVSTILQEISKEVDTGRPKRTKDRLETALDRLKDDGIISGWKYDSLKYVTGYKWVNKWLDCKIEITAPNEIIDKYTKKISGNVKPSQDDDNDG